jgi:hypothetical protein
MGAGYGDHDTMFSEAMRQVAERETRQSMLRVWLAMSAVWVAFWLLIAVLVAASSDIRYPFTAQIGVFAAVVVVPPAFVLVLGALSRVLFEALVLQRSGRPTSRRTSRPNWG